MAGLSQRDLAARMNRQRTELEVKQPRVHRIEIGEAVPTRGELEAWLGSTMRDDDEETWGLLGLLLEAAHNPSRPWRGLLGEERQLQARADERELDCKLIRNVSLTWIPGCCRQPSTPGSYSARSALPVPSWPPRWRDASIGSESATRTVAGSSS